LRKSKKLDAPESQDLNFSFASRWVRGLANVEVKLQRFGFNGFPALDEEVVAAVGTTV
jgi:hypothetical protein